MCLLVTHLGSVLDVTVGGAAGDDRGGSRRCCPATAVARLRGGSQPSNGHEQAQSEWATGAHGLPPPMAPVAKVTALPSGSFARAGAPRLPTFADLGFPIVFPDGLSPLSSAAGSSVRGSYAELPGSSLSGNEGAAMGEGMEGQGGLGSKTIAGDAPGVGEAGGGGRAGKMEKGSRRTAAGKARGQWEPNTEGMDWERRVVGVPRVIGNGTFGVVYAVQLDGDETVPTHLVSRSLALCTHPCLVRLRRYSHKTL